MATLADLFKTCYLTSGNGVEFADIRLGRGRGHGIFRFAALAHVDIGNPDVAQRRALVPDIDHVIGPPQAVEIEQAYAFADCRYANESQRRLRLGAFVLNLDLEHLTPLRPGRPAESRCRKAGAADNNSCF